MDIKKKPHATGKVKAGDTSQRVGVEQLESRGVDVKALIEKLTDAMVSIEGENMRGVTWVTIEEKRSGDWGIGGQPLTTEAVQALAAGKSSP